MKRFFINFSYYDKDGILGEGMEVVEVKNEYFDFELVLKELKCRISLEEQIPAKNLIVNIRNFVEIPIESFNSFRSYQKNALQ